MRTWRPGSVPEDVRTALVTRLEKHATRKWRETCRGVGVKFRGVYAYVDAFPAGEPYPRGITEEEKARLDAAPTHLCRLEYLGSRDRWGFAFYKYSDEKYEIAILPRGSFEGTPEECFDCAAMVYLQNW